MAMVNILSRMRIISPLRMLYKIPVNYPKRYLGSNLATMLRPLYDAASPEILGKYQYIRETNENSLKLLNQYLESLCDKEYTNIDSMKILKFYLRGTEPGEIFRVVEIKVDGKILNAEEMIQKILKACEFTKETEVELKDAAAAEAGTGAAVAEVTNSKAVIKLYQNMPHKPKKLSAQVSKWIEEATDKVRRRLEKFQELKEQVKIKEQWLMVQLKLHNQDFDYHWHVGSYYYCMELLNRLAITLAEKPKQNVEGTLFDENKPRLWLGLISTVALYEKYLLLGAYYDKELSKLLNGIQIKRKHFVPTKHAKDYVIYLFQVIQAVNSCQEPGPTLATLPDCLQQYELFIVSAAEQLKVNAIGQLMVPAFMQGAAIIEFIKSNLELCRDRQAMYKDDIVLEQNLMDQCMKKLELKDITKDDSITPDMMILTLTHLLEAEPKTFEHISVHITNKFSILTDGILCLPWDYMYQNAVQDEKEADHYYIE